MANIHNCVLSINRNDHIIFVMASDDTNWIKNRFSDSIHDVVFTSSANRYKQVTFYVVTCQLSLTNTFFSALILTQHILT